VKDVEDVKNDAPPGYVNEYKDKFRKGLTKEKRSWLDYIGVKNWNYNRFQL